MFVGYIFSCEFNFFSKCVEDIYTNAAFDNFQKKNYIS